MTDLRDAFAAFREANPKTRIRAAAREMGASEAELLATGVDGTAIPLTRPGKNWRAILPELEALGEVMALTRNDACVHEKHGVYENVHTELPHGMGMVLDEPIDLRLFCARWRFGFAVSTPWDGSRDGLRRSLQFFDAHGDAVHKVFLTRKSDVEAYEALVERHAAGIIALEVDPRPAPEAETPDAEVDADGFLAAWAALQDTHDFFALLNDFGVSRTQGLRLAEGRFAERVDGVSARRVLEGAAETQTELMIFVGNRGGVQIHSGVVKKLKEYGPWFNVLDPGFNLHLDENQITESWVVVKPTEDGDVTSLETYDASGEIIVQFFGKRKPGEPELSAWREILGALPRLDSVTA
ncbi:MAG: ChuX/HutX family heme-like substrate-binding protein [Bacteroidota bacterium]